MRIAADWGLCESNAVCEGIAPHVFTVGDVGMSRAGLRLVEAQPGNSTADHR